MSVMKKTLAAAVIGLMATPAAALAAYELNETGLDAFETYMVSPGNKAFAVASDGSWGWVAGQDSIAAARAGALNKCEQFAADCQIYSQNNRVAIAPDAFPADHPQVIVDNSGTWMTMPAALDRQGLEAFQSFMHADGNKAFAVGGDGGWAWRASDNLTLSQAESEALNRCENVDDNCLIYVSSAEVMAPTAAGPMPPKETYRTK